MPHPGGPGHPTDPVRDRPQDPGHGTPPTKRKKRRDPVRDRPQDPGHGTPPVSNPGSGGGSHSPYRAGTGQVYKPPAWVVRRQQILKRNGFGVAVDGYWGSHSQLAWEAFQAGQRAAAHPHAQIRPDLPTGFTWYQGRAVPQAVARAAQAVKDARINAAGIANRGFLQQARELRAQVAQQQATGQVVRTGEDLHTAYAIERRRQIVRKQREHAGALDIAADQARREQYLFGIHGPAMLALHPALARQRLGNLATAHDLAGMLRDGTLKVTSDLDVRVIQHVLGREGESVPITGRFDQRTSDAVKDLFNRTAAKDFKRGVHSLQTHFFNTGLGQEATHHIFGRVMTAGEAYAVLVQGGPRANRLSRYFGELYMQSEGFVGRARQSLAQQVYAEQNGGVHPGKFSDHELKRWLGRDTFKAHNLTDFYARYGAEADRQRMMVAKHSTSWWQDAIGTIYSKVDIPYSDQAGDILSWSGHQGYHLFAGANIFVYSNLEAAQQSVGLPFDLAGIAWDAQKVMTGPFGSMNYAVNSYLLPDTSAWRGNGYSSPDDAWHQGWVTLDDMRKSDPLRSMVWESVFDPLNLVGYGEVATVTKGVARGVRLGGEVTSRTFAVGAEHLGRYATLERIINDASKTKVLASDFFIDARSTFRNDRIIEWMQKLQASKAVALSRARVEINANVYRNFQQRIVHTVVRQAGEEGPAKIERAAHISPEERAAILESDGGKFAESQLDEALRTELASVMHSHIGYVEGNKVLIANAVRKLNVSLYRHTSRAGDLSTVGARLAAFLTEQANRSILDAAAIRAAAGDTEKLAALRAQMGSWYAGHLHPEIARYADQALADYRKYLYEQLIPDLDNIAVPRVLDEMVDADGFFLRAGEDEALAHLDELMGFDLEKVFNPRNYVKIVNPNARVATGLGDMRDAAQAEINRRQGMLSSWADRALHTARNDPSAQRRIRDTVVKRRAEIADEVSNAWKPATSTIGAWEDTRDFLHVPSIYAHGDPAFGAAPQLTEFAAQMQGLIDAALATGSSPLFREGTDTALSDLITRRADLLAQARSAISGHYYRRQGLVLESFNHAQRLWARFAWGTYKYAMETWRFAVLPLRMAFAFKNFVEDFAKMIVSGFRDIRLLLNTKGESVFDFAPYRLVRAITQGFDRIYGTNAAGWLDGRLKELLITYPDQMRSWFGAHGIEVPESLFGDEVAARGFLRESEPVEGEAENANRLRRLHDSIWDVMGTRPDNWRKRAMYAHAYRKAIARGDTEEMAFDEAIATIEAAHADALSEVDRVLFLYDNDHISVLEAQLKAIAPFIVYFRKNAQYLGTELDRKPWFFADAKRLYDLHIEDNQDQPPWMRRYFSLSPLGGISDSLGLPDWVGDAFRDAYFDPLDYTGTAAFYRIFKQSNPNLPDNQKGIAFVSQMVGDLNAFGIGLNPFVVSLAQHTGVLNRQVWHSFFPQTSVLEALTTKGFISDTFGSKTGFNIEDFISDPILSKLGATPDSELREDNFDYYVNQVIAAQVARGETPNRGKAEKDIGRWLAVQTIVGFTAGLYMRHITEQDLHFYAISNDLGKTGLDAWLNLTDQEQESYRLWKRRGYSPARFDNYRTALETARAFYQLPDEDKDAYLIQHPEIIGLVHPIAGDRQHIPTQLAISHQLLATQTPLVMELLDEVFGNPDFAPGVNSAAYDALVTPDLRKFWAANDTPMEIRARQTRGAYHHYVNRMSETFHAIPESDFEARSGFLAEHPELERYWALNDSASDDLRSIELSANATFRDIYFRMVEKQGFEGAEQFLRRHTFMFDWTSAEGRVDPAGQWHPRAQAQADYAKVSPDLGVYYALHGQAREDYAKAHPLVAWFLNKYGHKGTDIYSASYHYSPGGMTQHARDYLAIKPVLDAFFKLPNSLKEAFLNQHPELRNYFAKYSHQRTQSAHARAYLAIKPVMDAFFALPEGDRPAFLAKHPELQAYFDKWGSHKGHAAFRSILADDPTMNSRYHFWQKFYALDPDKRPEFIHKHAAEAGIFIYGSLSYDQRHRDYKRWLREAVAQGHTPRGEAYRHVKPLLDIYFSLKEKDRPLFAELNPEVTWYFDNFAKASKVIPPGIADELKAYFTFQPYSEQRKDYIEAHPELSDYFRSTQSPTERAMMDQVEAFFQLPFGKQRDHYLAMHPELAEWFDKRAKEKQAYEDITAAFNESDPRMRPFLEQYADIIPLDALKQWMLAHQSSSHDSGTVETRRERDPRRESPTARPRRPPGWNKTTS